MDLGGVARHLGSVRGEQHRPLPQVVVMTRLTEAQVSVHQHQVSAIARCDEDREERVVGRAEDELAGRVEGVSPSGVVGNNTEVREGIGREERAGLAGRHLVMLSGRRRFFGNRRTAVIVPKNTACFDGGKRLPDLF